MKAFVIHTIVNNQDFLLGSPVGVDDLSLRLLADGDYFPAGL